MSTVSFDAEVTHHFSKGVRAKEPGERGHRFTIWTSERPDVGSTVSVSGRLGAKVEDYQDKPYVALSVNDPVIQVLAATQTATQPYAGAQTANNGQQDDTWGAGGSYGDDTPF